MKHYTAPMLLVCTLMCSQAICQTQNQAIVVRSTELKAKPFSDAETLKSLKENQKLEVVSRKASWTEVKAQDAVGWVKMLSLRFEGSQGGGSNLGSFLQSGLDLRRGTDTGSTTTTAVKGLDKESFKNLSPNTDRLQKMQGFSANKPDAKIFAAQQNLNQQEQAYVKAEGDK
jgi:hypothetical protein